MPEKFGFPIAEQFWMPLRIDLTTLERGAGRLDVFGRLRDGVTIERARAEFEGITGRLSDAYPASNAGIVASLQSFTEEYVGTEFIQTVYGMLVGALLVLFVCCANVANLLLIRGAQRRRALAVRMSLGATHGHLVRQLMAEALALALLGAGIGIGIAAYGVQWFDRAGSQAGVFALPHGSDSLFWWDVSLNAPTLAAVICVTGLTTLLSGLLPALRVSRSISALQRERSDSSALGATRFANGLVVAQLALT
jgi:predicted lysophospholipase L1 biosynthesis ABC-type transport system permease subunit